MKLRQLRTCSAVVSGMSVGNVSSAWPQPLSQCTQLCQGAFFFKMKYENSRQSDTLNNHMLKNGSKELWFWDYTKTYFCLC